MLIVPKSYVMTSESKGAPPYIKRAYTYAKKYKILFLFAVLVISFFVLVGSVVLFKSRESAIRQARVESKNISYSLDQNIQNSFNKADLALVSIAKIAAVNDLIKLKNQDEKFKLLELYNKKLPDVFAFRITDKDGLAIFNTDDGIPSSFSVFDREYFQFHRTNPNSELFISKPIKSKFDGKQIITLSRRINARDQSFLGIVYAVIEMDHLREIISSIEVGLGGHISLISLDDSTILYRFPEDKSNIGQRISLQQEGQDLKLQNKLSGEWEQISTIDKTKKTFGIRLNYTYGYIVATGLAEKDYLRPWFINLYSALLLLTVLIASMIFALLKYISSQEQVEYQKNQMHASARKIAVGRMASGVAHEINNPLAIIKGKSEIARMLLGEKNENNSEVMSKLLDIEKMVHRVAKIVKGMQILGLERDEEHEVHSLQEIISSALEILSQKMTDLKIAIKIESIVDLSLHCNRSDMTEVFIHLISNSIDAVKSLEDKWIDISFVTDNGVVIIKVTDSGQGIATQEVASIMEPFYTTKPPGSGAGLGLSVSEAILRNHGGTLTHNHNSNHTQFVIKLRQDFKNNRKSA